LAKCIYCIKEATLAVFSSAKGCTEWGLMECGLFDFGYLLLLQIYSKGFFSVTLL